MLWSFRRRPLDEYLGGSASGAASGALATGEATDGDVDGALVGVCDCTAECDGTGCCGVCTGGVVGTTGFGTGGSSVVASGKLCSAVRQICLRLRRYV